MHPAAPAQIHVPDLLPPLPVRIAAALVTARLRLGLGLLVGGVLLALLAMLPGFVTSGLAGAMLGGTWLAAVLVALVTVARAGAWRSHVAPSARAASAVLFAGLALLLPLTLQVLLLPWVWAPEPYERLAARSLGGWVTATVGLTWLSHIVFAALCAVRGFRGHKGPPFALIGVAATAVTLGDCLVWGGFGLLPTAYVAVTSVPVLLLLQRIEGLGATGRPAGRPVEAWEPPLAHPGTR